jgi:hypothetical protein
MGQIGNDTFKQGYAFVPQSTVADACLNAMVLGLEDASPEFASAELLAQVHDSLLYQYHSPDFAAMARFAIRLGLDYLRPVIDYGEPFRLDVEFKAGFSWAHLVEIPLTEDEDAVAEKLREVHETLSTLAPSARAAA